jgi:hypothetical protein
VSCFSLYPCSALVAFDVRYKQSSTGCTEELFSLTCNYYGLFLSVFSAWLTTTVYCVELLVVYAFCLEGF